MVGPFCASVLKAAEVFCKLRRPLIKGDGWRRPSSPPSPPCECYQLRPAWFDVPISTHTATVVIANVSYPERKDSSMLRRQDATQALEIGSQPWNGAVQVLLLPKGKLDDGSRSAAHLCI